MCTTVHHAAPQRAPGNGSQSNCLLGGREGGRKFLREGGWQVGGKHVTHTCGYRTKLSRWAGAFLALPDRRLSLCSGSGSCGCTVDSDGLAHLEGWAVDESCRLLLAEALLSLFLSLSTAFLSFSLSLSTRFCSLSSSLCLACSDCCRTLSARALCLRSFSACFLSASSRRRAANWHLNSRTLPTP